MRKLNLNSIELSLHKMTLVNFGHDISSFKCEKLFRNLNIIDNKITIQTNGEHAFIIDDDLYIFENYTEMNKYLNEELIRNRRNKFEKILKNIKKY